MTRTMRPTAAASLLLLLFARSASEESRPVLGQIAEVRATRVTLDAGDPARRQVGRLTYLGGVQLRSSDGAFGGFSSMLVAGDRFTLLSDGGNIVRFRMGSDGVPREASFADLPDGPGTGRNKRDRDSESMVQDPGSGSIWVGFEHSNMIWRYDAGLTRGEGKVAPAALARWPTGGGAEAMVRLRDGRFVLIAESARPKGMREARIGLVYGGDPLAAKAPPATFAYVPPAGYSPTDMAELPDGRLLVLNRRFSLAELFTAKLVLIDLRKARAGAVVRGTELATLDRPLLHDNFEALAVTRENAETIVWIASDDNAQFWERSLLLKFRFDLPTEPAGP